MSEKNEREQQFLDYLRNADDKNELIETIGDWMIESQKEAGAACCENAVEELWYQLDDDVEFKIVSLSDVEHYVDKTLQIKIRSASDLSELCDAVNLGGPEQDIRDLETFSENEPVDTAGIWSWDATRKMVPADDIEGGFEIVDRDDVGGES